MKRTKNVATLIFVAVICLALLVGCAPAQAPADEPVAEVAEEPGEEPAEAAEEPAEEPAEEHADESTEGLSGEGKTAGVLFDSYRFKEE